MIRALDELVVEGIIPPTDFLKVFWKANPSDGGIIPPTSWKIHEEQKGQEAKKKNKV